MPKLKKRLPESRSEKRERLASEKELRGRDRQLAQARQLQWREQQKRNETLFREWRSAVAHRLDSGEAYLHFEAVHRRDWDLIRPIWLPNVDCSLAYQRLLDGKSADPEPLLDFLSDGHPKPRRFLRKLKKLALTPMQTDRLHKIVLENLAQPRWHARTREYVALLRRFSTPELYEKAESLSEEKRELVRWHLGQEKSMKNDKL
jgi:hypothetical protein